MSFTSKNHYHEGLTDLQVEESREKYGVNLLSPPKRPSLWKLYLEKFEDPVIRILLVAAMFSLFISVMENEYAETLGIFFAILLATGIGFYFEYDASKKFDLLNAVNEETPVKVVRNGQINEVPRKDVVVGDIVVLETGEEIPADGVLIEAISMQVNEANLTGEPVVSKTTDEAYFDGEATYSSNKVMRSTTVVDGHGMMKVLSVGDQTEIGKVAMQATEQNIEPTPLNLQLTRLANVIGSIGFGVAIVTFLTFFLKDVIFNTSYIVGPKIISCAVVLGLFLGTIRMWMPRKYSMAINKRSMGFWALMGLLLTVAVVGGVFALWGLDCRVEAGRLDAYMDVFEAVVKYFMMAVTLIVVAVPEGLPMSVTLSLALNMRRMLSTNNLVRKMHASETMGAITVICTDKTGTLTQNKMQVHEPRFYALTDESKLTDDSLSSIVRESISVNSTAFLERLPADGTLKAVGNPTEAALLLWLDAQGTNYLEVRESTTVISQLTFSTERKFMATLAYSPALEGKRVLFVKGAPEIVFGKCKEVLLPGGSVPAGEYKTSVEGQLLNYQQMAMRTLGFAYKVVDEGDTEDCAELAACGDLCFLGIVAISDPVRPDVPAAVAKCQSAGIDVKIVTGDTPGTATEIARQIGLWGSDDTDYNRITGVEFEAMSDEELLSRVKDLKIMSRARPTDKQRLVQLLQRKGEVVAVTGDGTNDAPALNFAHVGLSMGTGTSVAKEASDITLLDDSFNSIGTAVMWGRSLYKNIQRFIVFQLTINFVALFVVLFGSLFGTELPLTVTQMLWVNLIMDTFAALALASIPPDERVMNEKPRKSSDFIVSKGMKRCIFSIGFVFLVVLMGMLTCFYGSAEELTLHELTLFFTFFVMLQFWNLFNARVFGTTTSAFSGLLKSYGMLVVAAIIFVGQLLIVQFGGEVFRTQPLSAIDWLGIVGVSSLVLWVGELVRFIQRIRNKKNR